MAAGAVVEQADGRRDAIVDARRHEPAVGQLDDHRAALGVGSKRVSKRRSRDRGTTATPIRIRVANRMPSNAHRSAAAPPMTAPMIWPTARNTE